MEQLIKDFCKALDALLELYRQKEIKEEGKFFNEYPELAETEELSTLISATEAMIITPKGNTNYGAIAYIEDTFKGKIKIYPGEQDSFGWVTGVMEVKEGKVLI